MAVCIRREPAIDSPPRERVDLVLGHLEQFSSPSPLVFELLAIEPERDPAGEETAGIIESDDGLTQELLAWYQQCEPHPSRAWGAVEQGVAQWGVGAVRDAALAIELHRHLTGGHEDRLCSARRAELWRHAMAVAYASAMIGERLGGGCHHQAFACGLFHDIGKFALDTCLPKSYARVVKRVVRDHACICDAEWDLFGLDHTTAGKHLALRWGLPDAMTRCAWLHHQNPAALPSTIGDHEIVRIVHLADYLVRRMGIGFSGYDHKASPDDPGQPLGLTMDELDQLTEELPARMKPLGDLLSLDHPTFRAGRRASPIIPNHQPDRSGGKSTCRRDVYAASQRALKLFMTQLHEKDTIRDVCVLAARALKIMLATDQVIMFFHERNNHYLHFGCAGSPDGNLVPSFINLDEPSQGLADRDLPFSGPTRETWGPTGLRTGGWATAPEGWEEIWQCCTHSPPRRPLWMWPFLSTPRWSGTALVSAGQRTVHRFRSVPDEWEMLSGAIGLALSSAWTRSSTDRISEEVVRLNRRLVAAQNERVQARSISTIASMAGGAAHELNNPLSVISGRAQMELAKRCDDESARAMQIIIHQAQKATRIVRELMDFAKPAEPSPLVQPLQRAVEPLCQHWRRRFLRRAPSLTFTLADPRVTVYADPTQLCEIMDAVLCNAAYAADSETACVQINSPSRLTDEQVRIVVEDNGTGMTQDVLEHAIDPFFSSRSAGRGRGLGLSRAHRLIQINGGRLWIESRTNQGTTVTIELPARPPTSKG